jgi:electron transport complex protein RnfB
VIADACTGCELCVAPCPVDCITMVPRASQSHEPAPKLNRARYYAHNARITQRAEAQTMLLAARKQAAVRMSAAPTAATIAGTSAPPVTHQARPAPTREPS